MVIWAIALAISFAAGQQRPGGGDQTRSAHFSGDAARKIPVCLVIADIKDGEIIKKSSYEY